MIRTHFPQSQFIVVSLKEGMFNNANVIFRTKVRCSFCPDPAVVLTSPPAQFVDGVSTVMRTVPALKDMPPGANHVRAAQRCSNAGAAALKPARSLAGATRGGETPARGAGRCAEREHGALELHACTRTGCQSGMFHSHLCTAVFSAFHQVSRWRQDERRQLIQRPALVISHAQVWAGHQHAGGVANQARRLDVGAACGFERVPNHCVDCVTLSQRAPASAAACLQRRAYPCLRHMRRCHMWPRTRRAVFRAPRWSAEKGSPTAEAARTAPAS